MAISSNNTGNGNTQRRAQTRHTSSSGRFSYSYSSAEGADGKNPPAEQAGEKRSPGAAVTMQNTPLAKPGEPRNAQTKALYGSTAAQRACGAAFIIAGVIVAVPVLTMGAIAAFASLTGVLVLCAVGVLGCAALVFAGMKRLRLAATFDRYRNLIGTRETVGIAELAEVGATSAGKARANVKDMIARGLLKQATLDEATDTLLLTRDAAAQHKLAGTAAKQQERQRILAASVMPEESASDAPLTSDQRKTLERGEAFVAAIREGNGAIAGTQASRALDQMEHLLRAILDTATETPEVIGDLDQLMDYYLPTAVKLIDAYRDLEGQPVQTDSARASKREIEGALSSLNTAFEKLLDSLFHDKAIDVSADISVLHTVLAQDGLTQSPFEKVKDASRAAGTTN